MQLISFSKRLLMGSLVFLFAAIAWADFEIQDPHHVLEDLAGRVSAIPFELGMSCGQSVKFSGTTGSCHLKCSALHCTTECQQVAGGAVVYDLGTEECGADSTAVYGSNGFSAVVSKDDYIAGGNTWLIGLLKGLGNFVQPEGTVILEDIRSQMFNEIVNGQAQPFFGYLISASIQILPNTMTQSVDIAIDSRSSGLNQIIFVQFGHDDVFLKRKGILNAYP
jgi:hypothetical protein